MSDMKKQRLRVEAENEVQRFIDWLEMNRSRVIYEDQFSSKLPLELQFREILVKSAEDITEAEVKRDYQICRLRYTCEVAFSRVTQEASLQDTIPYAFFSCIDSINHWAHAHANLYQPLML